MTIDDNILKLQIIHHQNIKKIRLGIYSSVHFCFGALEHQKLN